MMEFVRVPCVKNGGMRFTINGHQYFILVFVTNVAGAGDIKELHVKGSNTNWKPLSRNWEDNWEVKGDPMLWLDNLFPLELSQVMGRW